MSRSRRPAGLDSPAGEGEPGLRHRAATEDFGRNDAITRPPSRKTPAPRKRATKPAAAPKEALPVLPGSPRKKAAIAGPKGKTAAAKQPPTQQIEQLDRLQALITATLDDDKAEDIVVIDLSGRASFADRMIIATGLADRQIAAMATHLHEKLHEAGFRKPLTEGANGTDWVLIDAGDIIIHLFKPESRSLYGLDKMWSAELDEAAGG